MIRKKENVFSFFRFGFCDFEIVPKLIKAIQSNNCIHSRPPDTNHFWEIWSALCLIVRSFFAQSKVYCLLFVCRPGCFTFIVFFCSVSGAALNYNRCWGGGVWGGGG